LANIFTKLCFIEASLRLFAQPIRKIADCWKLKADRGWRGLGSTFARPAWGRRKKHQHPFSSGWVRPAWWAVSAEFR
jgi:hypothetical protein